LGQEILSEHHDEVRAGERKLLDVLSYSPEAIATSERLETLRETYDDGQVRVISPVELGLTSMLGGEFFWTSLAYITRNVPPRMLAIVAGIAAETAGGRPRDVDGSAFELTLRLFAVLVLFSQRGLGLHHRWNNVVAGLPMGALKASLADWLKFGPGPHVFTPKHRNTIGLILRRFEEAGILHREQRNGWTQPAEWRGKPRKNKRGKWECWAFNLYFLHFEDFPDRDPLWARVQRAPRPEEPQRLRVAETTFELEPDVDETADYLEFRSWLASIRLDKQEPQEGPPQPSGGAEQARRGRGPPAN
jgi:hypothetical protein